MKRLLFLLCWIMSLAIPAHSEDGDTFTYTYKGQTIIYSVISEQERTCAVINGSAVSGALELPGKAVYNGILYTLVEIDLGAFYNQSTLTSVEIPSSVQVIGTSAFECCTGLTSVVIPNSVQTIGKYAFYGCTGLIKSAYPDNIYNPFSNGTAIAYPAQGATIENGVVVVDQSTLYFAPITLSGEYTISNTIKTIGSDAFNGCTKLASVVIPNSVQTIGDYAFNGCTGLASVVIPNSVQTIGNYAFNGCTGLASVVIPSSVQAISQSVFEGCTGLTSVKIPSSVQVIGISAFKGCTGLTSVEIPTSVQGIGVSAFEVCTGLTSVEIPTSVQGIGACAFYGCTSLTSVKIPSQTIYPRAFEGCTSLTSVEISNSVQEIGASAFKGCSKLTSVIIPNSVKTIGSSVFESCTGLIKSAYPDNISNPFSNGTAIAYPAQGATIENGVVVVDQSTLYFAPITLSGEYTVPGTIKTIGDKAFSLCKDITFIRMPATLSNIGKSAFEGCNLYDFTIPNSVKVFDMETLAGNPLKSLTVGSGVTHILGGGIFNNSNLEKIFWLGNIPPVGYEEFNPVVNFVSNDQYLFKNQILYPFLSSIFEVGGIVYVPVSPSERTCNVVDYLYTPSNAIFSVPATVENKGIQMKVIDVGAYAFYHHDYLIDISLYNNGVIDDYAFYDCLKLQSVTFGANIPEIKNHTFQNCEVLKRVENSPALTSIGRWAFSGCVGMEYFSVGNKIESFGEEAFSDCTGLTKFYSYATTPPVCGAQALDDIIKWNCTLYVPEGCESLYASAPQWKDFFYIEGVFAGIESIQTDDETDAEIFDLNGIKQTKRMEDLSSGIYIVRQGNKVMKKVVK